MSAVGTKKLGLQYPQDKGESAPGRMPYRITLLLKRFRFFGCREESCLTAFCYLSCLHRFDYLVCLRGQRNEPKYCSVYY